MKGREKGHFAGFYGETCELEAKRKVCYDWLVKKEKAEKTEQKY